LLALAAGFVTGLATAGLGADAADVESVDGADGEALVSDDELFGSLDAAAAELSEPVDPPSPPASFLAATG